MLAGYTIVETLYVSAHTTAHRARRDRDGHLVILRAPRRPDSAADVAKLRNEYGILRALGRERFLDAPEPRRVGPDSVLVSEDIGGVPLRALIGDPSLDLATTLWVGAELAERVGELHGRKIIHKDLSPEAVLVDVRARRVHVMSFNQASRLPREASTLASLEGFGRVLAYASPEQTGRMNRAVDYRTDFYSLGVILYEMLTGALPFRHDDPLELLHAHLVRAPPPPCEVAPSVPRAVSDIVTKLLAKNAEDRYQSSHGVAADLVACSVQLTTTGRIERVAIGEEDASEVFQVPQKLYAREQETAALVAAFERAVQGQRGLAVVTGPSGAGKTALVRELMKPVVRERGLFVTGKCEEGRDVPCLGVALALQQLARQVIADAARSGGEWQARLAAELGDEARVLTDLIPEIGLLLPGEPPPVPELDPGDAEARLLARFQGLLRVFAAPGQPLVIFLDDAQWADPASLRLLAHALGGPGELHLLVVLACREDAGEIAGLSACGAPTCRIALGPLPLPSVTALVADTMRCTPEQADPLARLLLERTGGEPLFLVELLLALHEERLVQYDAETRGFSWNLGQLRQRPSADALDVVASRLRRLPEKTRAALELAACTGDRFSLSTLAAVADRSRARVAIDLWDAVREGHILPLMGELGPEAQLVLEAGYTRDAPASGRERLRSVLARSYGDTLTTLDITAVLELDDTPLFDVAYRFAHDRVREGAAWRMSGDERLAARFRVAKLLFSSAEPDEEGSLDLASRLLPFVDRLNGPGERDRLAELFLAASRRAEGATAYVVARRYVEAAAALLRADDDRAPSLGLRRAELALLAGDTAAATPLFDDVLSQARSGPERAAVHARRAMLHRVRGAGAEAMAAIQAGLRALELDLPSPAEAARRTGALAEELAGLLAGRVLDDILDEPPLADRAALAAAALLDELRRSGDPASPELAALAALSLSVLSLRRGNTRASSAAHAVAGAALAEQGDVATGRALGRLGVVLAEERGDPRDLCLAAAWYGAHVSHRVEPLDVGATLLRRACDAGVRSGDPAHASLAAHALVLNALARGESLQEVLDEIGAHLPYLTAEARQSALGYRSLALWLMDEEAVAPESLPPAPRLWAFVLSGRWAEGAVLVRAAPGPAEGLEAAAWTFHAALVTAPAGAAELGALADGCPATFDHQHLLAQAEHARAEGRDAEAEDLYAGAMVRAQEAGFLHHLGLAAQRAADLSGRCGDVAGERAHAAAAHEAFARWGAVVLARALAERHPELAAPRTGAATPPAVSDRAALLAAESRCAELEAELVEQEARHRTELADKAAEIDAGMRRLVETRRQLVTQEKLASLGGITAGIAHEIKNPLNFVNNFALLSVPLIAELRDEIRGAAGALGAETVDLVEEILRDLEQNMTKIEQHGRRADSIVRTMLDHARSGSGTRRDVDLNALVAEYVNLASQGLRAREPGRSVALETRWDPTIPPVSVVPPDVGRVILNLVNNAWDAVRTKGQGMPIGYTPQIAVSTRRAGDVAEVRVRDNGTGVPAHIKESIFEAFFTTKPPGSGTGLGLSISLEIIQESGGTMRVETEEGQFSEFIVTLPAPARPVA